MTDSRPITAPAPGRGSDPASEPGSLSRRERRVGTFTFGVTLVTAGFSMMAALFFPALDIRLLLRCSPAVLVLLGVEVLLSARKGGRMKYDWLGMLLCFVLVLLALLAFFAAWVMLRFPEGASLW